MPQAPEHKMLRAARSRRWPAQRSFLQNQKAQTPLHLTNSVSPCGNIRAASPRNWPVVATRYNHYYTRSARDFERKLASGDVRGAAFVADQMYRKRMFSEIETMTAKDTSIERHVGKLIDRLRAKPLFSSGGAKD